MVAVTVLVGGDSPLVDQVPTGALYSTLVVTHVLSAVVGFGAVVLTGVQAKRAQRGPSVAGADGVRRYFRPGPNWAGRVVYAVPVLGFASIAASHGAWSADDAFVLFGLALWLVAALLAELVVWPAERRIQLLVSSGWDDAWRAGRLARDCLRASSVAWVVAAIFVSAVVVMVARP